MTIKVKTNWAAAIFLGMWDILAWIMVFTLLIGLISKPSEIESLGFAWIVLLILAIIIGNQVIWEITGKVDLMFKSDHINFINSNTLFKKQLSIPFEKIVSIEYKNEKEIPLGFRLFGFTSGNVVIRYYGGQKRIGKGFNKKESIKLIEELKNKIN